MTTAVAERNILRRDCDGNVYSIPEKMVDHFTQLSEAIENSEFMSGEWYEANDELNEQYGSFMKGN
jgi:hypothetical protein